MQAHNTHVNGTTGLILGHFGTAFMTGMMSYTMCRTCALSCDAAQNVCCCNKFDPVSQSTQSLQPSMNIIEFPAYNWELQQLVGQNKHLLNVGFEGMHVGHCHWHHEIRDYRCTLLKETTGVHCS